MNDNKQHQHQTSLLIYTMLVASAFSTIYFFYNSVYPNGISAEPGCEKVWQAFGYGSSNDSASIPRKVQLLWDCGEKAKSIYSLVLMCILWIFMKGLAIPGGVVLCVALGGFMNDSPIQAQIIASICEVLGGSLCYAISSMMGKPLLERYFSRYLTPFQANAEEKKKNGELFYFALFVRMTPLIPNWFVNAASPSVGIPFSTFFITMILGIQVATFLSIRTGELLFELGSNAIKQGSGDNLLNEHIMINFFILLAISIFPLLLKRFTNNNNKEYDKITKQE